MNLMTLKEFRNLEPGEIVQVLFVGGGRATPWIVLNAHTGEIKHLMTNRTLTVSKVGETVNDTRVYWDDPNPNILTFQEFCEIPENTWLFHRTTLTREMRYGIHESYTSPVSGQKYHMFRFCGGRSIMPTKQEMDMDLEEKYELWVDVFHERNSHGISE